MITKYCRPKTFNEIEGQSLPKAVLKAISKSPETSPRTIILEGEYGTGKTSSCRVFARALNCSHKNKDGDACGKCENCLSDIENSIYYSEYDSSVVGNITDIKELKETFIFNKSLGWKVIVLDEAHLISVQAQSALLKILEEGIDNVFFILCTTNYEKILNTIRSRALTLTYDLLSKEDIEKNLKNICENYLQISVSNNIIQIITERSKGHLRDAQMLLEQYRLLGEDDFIKLYRSCSELFKMFICAIMYKKEELIPKIIDTLLHHRLVELKSEYELFVLSIIKAFYKGTDDKQLETIINFYKHKKNNFIDIINDYRNYDFFTSDTRFTTLMWLLADRLKRLNIVGG